MNDLIERVAAMAPLRPDGDADGDELEPLPRSRSATGTPLGTMTMQGLGTPPVLPAKPADKAGVATMQGLGPVVQRTFISASRPMPVDASFESGAMAAGPSQAWLEHAHAQLAHVQRVPNNEAWIGTIHVRRPSWKALAGKLVVPMIGLALLGGLVGYFALGGEGGPPLAAAPAAPASPRAPAAAAATAPAPAPVQPAFVDVMLVSEPAGATVTLVDRGKTSFIGTTPISIALDPSRKYELVFEHPSKPAWIEPIDPSTTRRVDVKLGRAARRGSAK